MLQLFDLCPPQEHAMIRRADLESVLQQHLGRSEAASGVRKFLGEPPGEGDEGLLDFLSYWQGMDRLFAEAGAWPSASSTSRKADVVGSMQAFRDGVLSAWCCHASKGEIPPSELLDLLSEVQEGAEDPQFWAEVMRAVPQEGGRGLPLAELARAVCAWLRRHVGGGARQEPGAATTPRDCRRRRSCSADARLGPRSEASSSSGTPSPWAEGSTSRCGRQRRSTVCLDGASTPAEDLQRAVEFVEFLGRSVDPGSHAHQAQQQLLASLGSLSRALQRQEMDLSSLRSSNAALGQKRETLEAELATVREFQEEVRELQEQRDEERQRGEALEIELLRVKEQYLHSSEELERLRADTAECQRERMDTERRDWHWRDRCSQLEQAADTAEGHARWMREELEQQRGELSAAQEQREASDREVARLRQSLRAASDSLRSHVAYAAESDECIEELRRQLAAGGPPGAAPEAPSGAAQAAAAPAAEAVEPEVEDGARRTQLELLRAVRDELLGLDAGRAEAAQEPEDGAESPRHLQARRRCRFLELQLEALLRHTQAVERVLDTQRDSQFGPSPELRRRQSIQQVQQDGEALFNELSERLHTLEVQKADADQEVQRLQAKIAELRRELAAVRQSREDLLLELGSARHASVRDELTACLKGEDTCAAAEPSATSETRSVSSSSCLRAGGDCGGFLTEAHGTLHPSPKGAFMSGVNKVVSAQFLATSAERPRRGAAGSDPGVERSRKGHRKPAQDVAAQHHSERKHRETKKKAEGDCDMQ